MEPSHHPEPEFSDRLSRAMALMTAVMLTASGAAIAQEPTSPPHAPGTPPDAPIQRPEAPNPPQESGFLGVTIDDLGRERARELGLSEARGALVLDVLEDSPASKAGLQEDDVVVAWDGQAVRSALQLRRLVRETPPEREVSVAVRRDGERREMTVTLASRPGVPHRIEALDEEDRRRIRVRMKEIREHAREAREHAREEAREARKHAAHPGPRIGVRLMPLSDQLAEYFGLDEATGALVIRVEDDSPAGRSGFRAGDVVLEIAGSEVASPSDAARLVRDAAGERVQVTVLRRGERRSLSVEVPTEPEAARAGDEDHGLRVRLRRIGPEIRAALEGMELPARTVGPEVEGLLEELRPSLRRLVPLLRGDLRTEGLTI